MEKLFFLEKSHAMSSTSKDQFTRTPIRKKLQADRRRPNLLVKALTSSEVSEKFNKLLDIRLDVVNFSKKHLEQQMKYAQEKHERETRLLDLEIIIKKERLDKIKNSNLQ